MLRSAATASFWDAAQVRQLVSLITFQRRVDAVVMLFKKTIDLKESFYGEVWSLLKKTEQQHCRRRLGESLMRILHEFEPEEGPAENTTVVFMTEVDASAPEGVAVAGDAPGTAASGALAEKLTAVVGCESEALPSQA
jgi:hypothetical protein